MKKKSSNKKILLLSGLPASGKTTLGTQLAEQLGFHYLDKDHFLESLLQEALEHTPEVRRKLSRRADQEFIEAAKQHERLVLSSFWRPPGSRSESGTDCDWISSQDTCLEICLRTDPLTAAKRFRSRQRHPGHLDHLRSVEELTKQFEELQDWYPLGKWPVIEVNANHPLDPHALLSRVQELLAV